MTKKKDQPEAPAGGGIGFGGSFAPPIDPDTLAGYEDLISNADIDPATKDAALGLVNMVNEYHKARPKSRGRGTPHPSGLGTVVKLPPEAVEALDPHVPWKHELQALGGHPEGVPGLFDRLPSGTTEVPAKEGDRTVIRSKVVDEDAKALRDACFHLLWYGIELTNDRDPLTNDLL